MTGKLKKLLFIFVIINLILLASPTMAEESTDMTWHQFHKDVSNSGYSPSTAPDSNKILWESDVIDAIGASSPVVAEAKVFVNCDGSLKALDVSSGSVLWSTSIPGIAYNSWSSPSYHAGNVFTATGFETNCINATNGDIVWTFTSSTGSQGSVNGGPTIADGKVFINDWDGGHYYCLNEDTGQEIWNFSVDGDAQGTPSYDDGKVFLTSYGYGARYSGHVYCVDSDTGTQVWHYGTKQDCCGSAAVHDDIVYVTTYNFYGDGDLFALNKTEGTVIWQRKIQRTDATPAIAYGNVYVTGGCYRFSNLQTYCFNATTGEPVWETSENETIGDWTCSTVVADGKVFVGQSVGGTSNFGFKRIYALDAYTGEVLWTSPHGGSAVAICDGVVYTIGSDGKVYAFAGGETTVDLLSKNIDIPEKVFVNLPNEITATVENVGSTFSGEFNVSLKANGAVVAARTISVLGGGYNKNIAFSWIPETTGDYLLEVLVDADNSVAESDETNNDALPVTLTATKGKPDLVPVSVAPEMVYENQPYEMSAVVENSGFDAAYNCTVIVKEEDTVVSSGIISSLYPSDSTCYNFMWTPSMEGTSNLTVIVDSNNEIIEEDETNNDFSCQVTVMAETEPEPLDKNDWTQFQRNWLRNASSASSAPTTDPNVFWKADQGGDVDVSPLIAGDTVYVYSSSGYIRAYNKSKGTLIWSTFVSTGLQTSTPAYGDGKIFAATQDGNLLALDAVTGNELWSVHPTDLTFECPITYYDHRIYIGEGLSGGIANKQYYCYDDLGNRLWAYTNNDTAGFIWNGASVVGDYVVYPVHEGFLVSLDRCSGELVDKINLSSSEDVSFAREVPGMFRSSLSYFDGYVYTTSESGQEYGFVWKVGFDESTGQFLNDGWSIQNGFSTSTPVVYNGRVYVGQGEHGYTGNLTCLNDADGSVIWSYYVDAGIKSSPAVSVQEDNVYIYFTSAVEDGSLFCLKDNGTEASLRWEYNPPDDSEYILQGAAISDCNVYFGTDGGYLYCIADDDWNPWNNYESVDGEVITTSELYECYSCWKNGTPAPDTGAEITTSRLFRVFSAWKN